MIVRETSDAPIDDTPYILNAGDTFEGSIEVSGDTDFVGLNLIEGETYTILFEPDRYVGSISMGIYDPDGFVERAFGDQSVFLTYTALETGIHYVSPTYGGFPVGSYELTLGSAEGTIPGTVDEIADYLTTTFWEDFGITPPRWDLDASREITIDLSALAPEGRETARVAFAKWAEVSDLNFVEVSENADIRFEISDDWAYVTVGQTGGELEEMVVYLPDFIGNFQHEPGDFFFTVVLHEIGHTLGLGHPGPYNLILPENPEPLFQNDNTAVSAMSYFRAGEAVQTRASYHFEPHGPMLADIAAIQQLYGNVPLNTGNTVYQPRPAWRTEGSDLYRYAAAYLPSDMRLVTNPGSRGIVDDGGIDTLDMSLALGVRVIDLEFGGTITRVDRNGGLMFSENTVIENVIGPGGINATILGNAVDNIFFVNGPDSIIDGRDGLDTSVYTRDRNEYIIDEFDGVVTILHRAATSNLTGDTHLNVERFSFADGEYDLAALAAPILEGVTLKESEVGGGQFRGTEFADHVFAVFYGAQADLNEGDDVAIVLTGDSRIDGGAGHDRLFGGTGQSSITGGTGDDVISGDGSSPFYGDNDSIDGGGGDDILMGGPGADTFVFRPNEGHDTIVAFQVQTDGVTKFIGPDFDPSLDRVRLDYGRNLKEAEVLGALNGSSDGVQFSLDGTQILFVGLELEELTIDAFIF